MRLIIPSAKVVPEELQKLGKLPAIIYPINQKITFDYLYEQYKEKTNSIDIICYENEILLLGNVHLRSPLSDDGLR